jgi:hypothetical protein
MSETILYSSSYTDSATLQSDKVKGDGYYGMSDGLHTIMIDLNGFIGTIKIQGSLTQEPTEADWFMIELDRGAVSLDTTGKASALVETSLTYTSAETSIKSYNATGNFVWIRADISDWSAGTISRIELNR